MKLTASKPAIYALGVCHPRFGSMGRRIGLAAAYLRFVRPMKTSLVIAAVLAVAVSHAHGEISSISLHQLAEKSDIIAIARVEATRDRADDKTYARAAIIETWKGRPSSHVKFLATPTWACDISEAVTGETALLFLTWEEASRSYVISHAGRGRMPLRTVRGKRYATLWEDVILPRETATIAGPERKYDFIRSVELATLQKLVRGALATRPNQSMKLTAGSSAHNF
jgi:hypothetical protein